MKNIKIIILLIFLVLVVSKTYAQNINSGKSFFEGPYVGGAIGYTKFKNRFNDPMSKTEGGWYLWDNNGNPFNLLDLKKSKITGIVSAGNNWVFNRNYLLGFEAEISSGYDQKWKSANYNGQPTSDRSNLQEDINYIANLRIKAGTVYEDKNLLYLTAGPTIANAKYHAFYSGGAVEGEYPISIDKKVYGLSYGVGIERQIDDKGSLKLEYMLTDLDSQSKPYVNSSGSQCHYADCRGPSWKTKISSIRLGYNYHF